MTTLKPITVSQTTISSERSESILLAFFALALWFLENVYFGWNRTPATAEEGIADAVVIFLFFMAFLWKPANVTHETTNLHVSQS